MKFIVIAVALVSIGIGGWVYQVAEAPQVEISSGEVPAEDVVTTDVDKPYEVIAEDLVDATELISQGDSAVLSQAEMDGLRFMREEEKLARDVYLALYERWGSPIFSNIAKSEQTHMDAVGTLLTTFGITDPASELPGVFSNAQLQALYNELDARGGVSLAEAFTVGAYIEDLDIRDLATELGKTENPNIIAVYESLQRGSRNHLRAFNRQIVSSTGAVYEPQFISSAEFEAIIASETERGAHGGRGAR
jgi:hypothetical protein